jgi:hypothetical protein
LYLQIVRTKTFIRKRWRSIIDIGYGSYFNSFTGEQKHKKVVPEYIEAGLKSLFVGWKVYSSGTNKAKNYSYSILYRKCTDCRIKENINMKYFISSLGFWSKNVTSILNKNILLLKKKSKIIISCSLFRYSDWLFVTMII